MKGLRLEAYIKESHQVITEMQAIAILYLVLDSDKNTPFKVPIKLSPPTPQPLH